MTPAWLVASSAIFALATVGTATPPPGGEEIAPEGALARLNREGALRDATVTGSLDLTGLRPRGRLAVELLEVTVRGALQAGGTLAAAVHVRGGTVEEGIRLAGAQIAGLTLEGVQVGGVANFGGAIFTGPLRIQDAELRGAVSFRGARFRAPVEVLDTRFARTSEATIGAVSFKDAVFEDTARFDGSQSQRDLWFDSAVFERDASFLKLQVDAVAYFRNTHFMRDAEFRFCRLGTGDFGNYHLMTAFHGLADFRGCTMEGARFDYAEFLGNVAFVNARIGPGGLSLENASFRGATTDLSGLRVTGGRLSLGRAHFAALRFRWDDLSAAVLAARPASHTLAALHRHLEATAVRSEALELAYEVAQARLSERLRRDDLKGLQWLFPRLELLLWAMPTGHGNKLDRIVGCSLLASLAVFLVLCVLARLDRLRFVRLVTEDDGEGAPRSSPIYRPVARATETGPPIPVLRGDLFVLVRYTLSLMFKLPSCDLRPVGPRWVGRFLRGAHLLGAALLALTAVTLANVSPAVQAIIGKITL